MSDEQGPWSEPPRQRMNTRRRVWVYLGLLGATALGVFALAKLFPGQVTGSDWFYPAQDIGMLAVVASAVLASRRFGLVQVARYTAIWAAVAVVMVLAYLLRGDLHDLGQRFRSQLVPAYAAEDAPGVVAIGQSRNGDYVVIGKVNGRPVEFVVDTGASDVVLSPADARRLGIDPTALKFDDVHETANGPGRGARFVVDSLSIGPIQLHDLPVSINAAEMSRSLLGMSVLQRLDSFEFKGGRLLMRYHGG